MKLSDLSAHEPVTATATETIRAVAEKMQTENVGAVVIVDHDRRVAGIVTDRDIALATAVQEIPRDRPVGEIMHGHVVTIWEDEGVFNATQYFLGHRVRRLPVVDHQDRLQGVISVDDVFALLARELFNVARALEPALGDRV
jgi:CBS domain-containing protein